MATIYDVAKAAGVSITTVSHALNGTRYVSDETKGRVLRAAEETKYRPSSLARALVSQETQTLGVIVPDNVNPFFAELARGIEDSGFRAGYSVILCNSDRDSDKERAYLDTLVAKRVDGIIFMSMSSCLDPLQPVLDFHIPVVLFDRECEGVDSILLDNHGGGYKVTRYLAELGHRRIACIAGPDPWTRSGDRTRGYQRALADSGLAEDPNLIVGGDWSYQSGRDAACTLLKCAPLPSAIFACNDTMAIGVLSYLYEIGMRVPGDISVVGFDNISLSAYTSPPLTTVATPILELGEQLCRLLLGRISSQLPHEPQHQMVVGTLVQRGSAAPP